MKPQRTSLGRLLVASALVASGPMYSCATVEKGTSRVDKERGHLVVVSTSDKRTAMQDPATSRPFAKASEKLELEIQSSPRDVQSIVNHAQIKLAQGHLDEAERLAKQALRVDLRNLEAKKILAETAFRKDSTDLAELILNGLGGSGSKDSQVLNLLALIALKKGQNAESMALFRKALQVNPDDVAVRLNLGVLQLRHRQLNAAAVQFERVLKSMPDNRDALLHLAIIKAFRGQKEEAVRVYNAILSSKKENPLALFNLAVAEKQLGEFDDALDHIKKYLQTRPTDGNQTAEAFALIDEIQSQRAARGQQVSDEEIQMLAARMGDKKDSTAAASKPAVTASRTSPVEHETQPKGVANKAASKPAVSGQPTASTKSPPSQRSAPESIDELEKALE